MEKKNKRICFKGQTIYAGIDAGKKSWEVSIYTDEFEHKTFRQPPEPGVLVRYLRRQFPGARYRCVYEAGYFGFWIHEALSRDGMECIVVHPGDVPTKQKERMFRTNKRDARKLARGLRSGDLDAIYVPSCVAQQDRSLVRLRWGLSKKQTRCKNQIKGFLTFYGIVIPEDQVGRHWSRAYVRYLEGLDVGEASGREALTILLEELTHLRGLIVRATRAIRVLSRSDRYREMVGYLRSIPGVGLLTAMTLLTEVVEVERFKNLDRLASYVGLVPGEDSTGETPTLTGITPRRNRFLRGMLIESAWVAVRKDPALLLGFTELTKRMPKTQAIIRIARKLLNRIRYVLKNRQEYVTSVLE